MNELTIENAESYLTNMYFNQIKFNKEENGSLYFYAIDEDEGNENVEVAFEPEGEKIIVSVKYSNEQWIILEILQD